MTLLLQLAQSHPSKWCEIWRLINAFFSPDSEGSGAYNLTLMEIQNKELTTFCLPAAISQV